MARANGVREIWASGKAVVNSWLGVPSSFSAEVMGHAGWDSLVVDMQEKLMPLIVEAVRARATVGEISDALRSSWGEYRPT